MRRLGRYELVRRVGKGGEGEVWEAVLHGPSSFRRKVAVKLLPERRRSDALRAALVREARVGALVSHPNVVSTLELGSHEGRWFLVMDLVRGGTARRLVRREALPPAALLDLGQQAAEGLAHIHGLRDDEGRVLGVVHRDVKPGNLLVGEDGRVRLVDLGIAGWRGDEGGSAGTPGYMAPEQRHGGGTAATDVFGLCATLASLALRRTVLGKGPMAVALLDNVNQVTQSLVLREDLDAYLPGLGMVLARGLRHDPAERWGSALALGEELTGLYASCDRVVRLAAVVPTAAPAVVETPKLATAPPATLRGRDRELVALAAIQRGSRVLVTGPPGSGTTRLVRACWPDALWVSLGGVADEEGLDRALDQALGRRDGGWRETAAAVEAEVVVLDGAEAVVGWIAAEAERWGDATLVVTSRRVVPWPGAVQLQLGPLPLDAAVQFYQDQAGGGAPEVMVQAIVRALDRMPLAVELAAARARVTSHEAVHADALGGRTLDDSLRATWSLLPPISRACLAALSVFEGAFGVEAAAAVLAGVAGVDEPTARIDELVAHGTVSVRGDRLRLLRVVRAFAARRSPSDREAAEVRHGRWLAAHGRALFDAWGNDDALAQLLPWQADLAAAYEGARSRREDDTMVPLAMALGVIWWARGPREAAIEVAMAVLPKAGRYRSQVLAAVVNRLVARGDLDAALKLLDTYPFEEGSVEAAHAGLVRARVWSRQGRLDDAVALLSDVERVLRRAGDGRFTVAGYVRGECEVLAGRYQASLDCFEKVVEETLQLAPSRVPRMRFQVVTVRLLMEGYADAVPELRMCIEGFQAEGRLRQEAAAWLNLGETLRLLGALEEAAEAVTQGLARAEGVDRWLVGAGRAQLAWLRLSAGDVEGAVAHADVAQAEGLRKGDAYIQLEGVVVKALASLARGGRLDADPFAGHRELVAKVPPLQVLDTVWVDLLRGARREAARGMAQVEAAPFRGPHSAHALEICRAAYAHEGGQRGAARAHLLQADLSVRALGLGLQAPWMRRLENVRAQVAGGRR